MKTQMQGTFDNANVKNNGICVLRFKFPYSEIGAVVQVVTALAVPISALAISEPSKAMIKNCSVKQLSFDKDGESKLSIEGDVQDISLPELYGMVEQNVILKIKTIGNEQDEEK